MSGILDMYYQRCNGAGMTRAPRAQPERRRPRTGTPAVRPESTYSRTRQAATSNSGQGWHGARLPGGQQMGQYRVLTANTAGDGLAIIASLGDGRGLQCLSSSSWAWRRAPGRDR